MFEYEVKILLQNFSAAGRILPPKFAGLN